MTQRNETSKSAPNHPVSSEAAKSAKSSKSSDDVNATNIKETLESILVAFILAFVFRAFIVEAFVIPTGSMAPTLMGAHFRFQCPDCGYKFDVNFTGKTQGDEENIPPDAIMNHAVFCPNCGLQIAGKDQTLPVFYGDRILVQKYLYMGLPGATSAYRPFGAPRRWDVVVFKAPVDPRKGYTVNFIKRLIGTPGETIMVLDGDIYVKAKGASNFQIQTKPRYAQEALWRIVYDDTHRPAGLVQRLSPAVPWQQPWESIPKSAAGWKTAPLLSFAYSGQAQAMLRFDPSANPEQHSLTDYLAYDEGNYSYGERNNTVSDLKLELNYTRQAGDGPLQLSLSKYDTLFTARLSATEARLIKRVGDGPEVVLQTVSIKPPGTESVHVEFMNVDYQVTLRLNGLDVIHTNSDQYAPDIAAIKSMLAQYALRSEQPPLPQVSITAQQQTCAIDHLKLWRDVYYTPHIHGSPAEILQGNPNHDPPGVTLGDDEYFVMGDNSWMSFDARFWPDPVDLVENEDLKVDSGRVPGRFLLGKAFFVYWPAGYRIPRTNISLIPNFGDMRFIH